MKKWTLFTQHNNETDEAGQSIVLIALILVALLAFVGLAVDVGFIFARSSQLQAAVDAAALAGVTELINGKDAADTKAGQLLNANNVPISNTRGVSITIDTADRLTPLGATEYSVTVTWPVELFFLRLLRQDDIDVTRSATAAIFYLADVYASRRVEDGTVSTSTQGIFGPNICHNYGDPFTPLGSPWHEPTSPTDPLYTYKYRILVPPDYPTNILRVEIFDPDSINAETANPYTIPRTQAAINTGLPPTTTATCSNDRMNPCTLQTGELTLYESGALQLDQINPFYFVRIDENRGTGAAPGNGGCGNPGSYNPAFNTRTQFELAYFRQNPDGTVQEIPLVSYTGQVGDGVRDNGGHMTDMHWVSPGADVQGPDYPLPDGRVANGVTAVPVDPGSSLNSFEINLDNDIPNIVTDPATGARYVYLNVKSISGASENGFEIWAGPPPGSGFVHPGVPSEVNARNVYVANNPGSHNSRGVTIFAQGRLPMNSIYPNPVAIPLIFVGPELAGGEIQVSLYDTDSGAQPPLTFFFDSIAEEDWSLTFGQPGVDDPDGVAAGVRCLPGSCNSRWVDPPYRITIPGILDNCNYENPTQEDCTPFYGGRLMVRYQGGSHDTFGWEIRLNGLPYLVE